MNEDYVSDPDDPDDPYPSKWRHGIIALNGKIYGIPWDAARVLKIDPEEGTTELIGNDFGLETAQKWATGICAKNGKIYAIPHNARRVLQIDPSTDTTSLIGQDFGDTDGKWGSCDFDGEGNIFCSPLLATKVLRIDPTLETTTLVGGDLILHGKPLHCIATISGGNGFIYGVQNNARRFTGLLQIDPLAGTTAMIAFRDVDASHTNWFVAQLSFPVYALCCPTTKCDSKVLIEVETFWSGNMASSWSRQGARGKDGYTYGIPGTSGQVLQINSVTGMTELIGPDFGVNPMWSMKWSDCVMCPNGMIYCVPCDANQVLQIDASRWKFVRHLVVLRELVRRGRAMLVASNTAPLRQENDRAGLARTRLPIELTHGEDEGTQQFAELCRFIFLPAPLSHDVFYHIIKFI